MQSDRFIVGSTQRTDVGAAGVAPYTTLTQEVMLKTPDDVFGDLMKGETSLFRLAKETPERSESTDIVGGGFLMSVALFLFSQLLNER